MYIIIIYKISYTWREPIDWIKILTAKYLTYHSVNIDNDIAKILHKWKWFAGAIGYAYEGMNWIVAFVLNENILNDCHSVTEWMNGKSESLLIFPSWYWK